MRANKKINEFCQYCGTTYDADKSFEVRGIVVGKSHNCKAEKEFREARSRVRYEK